MAQVQYQKVSDVYKTAVAEGDCHAVDFLGANTRAIVSFIGLQYGFLACCSPPAVTVFQAHAHAAVVHMQHYQHEQHDQQHYQHEHKLVSECKRNIVYAFNNNTACHCMHNASCLVYTLLSIMLCLLKPVHCTLLIACAQYTMQIGSTPASVQSYKMNMGAHYIAHLKIAENDKMALKEFDRRLPFDIEDLAMAAGLESTLPSRFDLDTAALMVTCCSRCPMNVFKFWAL